MNRRLFIEQSLRAGAGALVPAGILTFQSSCRETQNGSEFKSDIVIIGGGLGGCAAAIAACSQGASVIMTEPTEWIGGQVSAQGVPPDEHQWIESFGRTRTYAKFRELVRDYYRNHYPLSSKAMGSPHLNPGGGLVSRLCHEPGVGLAVLESMLAPEIQAGRLRVFLNARPVEADVLGDRILAVTCMDEWSGNRMVLQGKMFIDASEEGDLLPLAGTEYVIGAESRKQTGEPHAPEEADPGNIQSMTWCFAMDHLEGEEHIIERPALYDFWKDHVPDLAPPWSGKLLSLSYSNPRTLQPAGLSFIPPGQSGSIPPAPSLNLWLYRRILDRENFRPGSYASDITLVNWPQNDYMLGNITDVPESIRKENLYKAGQLSLSLLYWLQTEAPRPDGGQGWPGLRLRKDMFGTSDGLAKYPYIRESRRIAAELTIVEQDLALEQRKNAAVGTKGPLLATPYPDSVGIGYYHLDLHPSTGGDNYIDMASVPFQIPLGAMIPVRIENLVPGCKNIGTTHISNGCYRLHPVEWSIGEAAGHLCAYSLKKQLSPRSVRNTVKHLEDFQSLLVNAGIELEWEKLT